MSPNATEHGAESMDDSSSSFEEDSNSVSSKPEEDDKQPRVTKKKGSKTSSTTNSNYSTSTSATATVMARHPTSQSGLPTFAAAAAAAAPRNEKRPRKAGFRDHFLPKLRVMLDYETHNDSTIVHWSNDGNSFIVTDKTKFEADIYPTYFDSRIIFATFLSKLYRWGFSRLSTKSGRYEFRSPTFIRLASDSAPAAPAAAAVDTSSKAGGGASIPVQQQHQTQAASTLQQVMAQTNQPPAHNPLPSQVNGIADLFSNIQRNSQQPSLSSQQSVMNRVLNMNLFHQQPFQQLQHPNPTTNLLTAALSILAGNQAPSAPLIDYSPVCHQGDAIQTLMSLYGMSSSHANGTFPNTNTNTNTTPAISQPDNAVQSLLMQIHQVSEDERQRRAKADSVQNAINASIGQIFGASNTIDEAERQRGLLAAALGQTLLGSTGEATTPNVPLATHLTGTTLPVPYIAAAGQMQQGIPPPSAAGSLNFQAHPIAAILQAARRPDDDDGNDEGKDDRPLSLGKRKSRDDGYSNNSRRKKK